MSPRLWELEYVMDRFFTSYQEYPIVSIAELATLLPILIGLFRFRSSNYEIKFLVIFFVCFFARDILTNILAYEKKNNLFIYNLFSFLELIFLALIFYNNQRIHSAKYRRIVLLSVLLTLLIDVFFYSTTSFSTGNFTIVRVCGIVVTMKFFERVLSELYIKNILVYSMFWVNSGLLLYFCGTFFIFLLGDKVLSSNIDHQVFQQYWDTNLIFYILFCLLASIGIWFSRYDKDNLV